MAKFVFGMNQSLDGYVDHTAFDPDPVLFQHFVDQVGALTGSLYGRVMYEIMRYWDDDVPEWTAPERAFAEAWRRQPKWVVSNTLKSVGPNANLVRGDLATAARELKAAHTGEIEIAGPTLAGALSGLIDEYRLYLHPVVLGAGQPFFTGPRPPLRLIDSGRIGEVAARLVYVSVRLASLCSAAAPLRSAVPLRDMKGEFE